jgi:hypothetical protein
MISRRVWEMHGSGSIMGGQKQRGCAMVDAPEWMLEDDLRSNCMNTSRRRRSNASMQ